LIAAAVAVLAFVLGLIGLRSYQPPVDWADAVYHSFQLFTLDSDALAGRSPVNGWMQVARFLAPVATLLAVVVTVRGLLGEHWRRRRISATTDHVIVCGQSDSALALARDLRGSGTAVVLIGDSAAVAADGGVIPAVPGDPREPSTLQAAGIVGARALYACADRSAFNAAVALAAAGLRTGPATRLETFAQVRSDDLVDALRVRRLRAAQPGDVTMDFFVVADIAARHLITRHPVGAGTPLLVGFGPLGQAVLRAIVRSPRTGDGDRQIVVRTAAADSQVGAEAARLDAATRGWRVRRGAESDADGTVYVCLADEEEALSIGLRLSRSDDQDVVVCLQRRSPFGEALDSASRLKIFGVLDEACRAEAIAADSITGRAARAIHERYCAEAAARGETRSSNRSMVPWAELPPSLQDANFAQAEGIGEKLKEIRAGLTTRPPATPFSYRDGEIDHLARLEHERWMAERRAAGYRHGPQRRGNEHPDLLDWDYLSPAAQKKDRDAVENLPALLAAEGLYIRRDPGT
jgi:voltage-gated potassium channel Kch